MRFRHTEQEGWTCSISSGDRPISGLSPPHSLTRAAGLIPQLRASNEGQLFFPSSFLSNAGLLGDSYCDRRASTF